MPSAGKPSSTTKSIRVMQRLDAALGLTSHHNRGYQTAQPHERRVPATAILDHVRVHDDLEQPPNSRHSSTRR